MTILKVLSAVPTRYSHQQRREQQSWRSIHRKEEKEMHFPFPFMVYPDSKYLAVIHIFPWNLPKLLKQCRNHPWALLEADPGVSMLMHISSPEYPMALLVFQPQEIPIWSCKAPNSCDSKAHRDLGRHNPPSFRNSCQPLWKGLSALKMTLLWHKRSLQTPPDQVTRLKKSDSCFRKKLNNKPDSFVFACLKL